MREKQFALFLGIPCLFYLSADIGRNDAHAAIASLDMIMIDDAAKAGVQGAKGDLPFSRGIEKAALAGLQDLLIKYGDAPVGFSFDTDEANLPPPEARAAGLRAMTASLAIPEFRLDEKLKLFETLKQFSIYDEAGYAAAQHCLAEAIYFESRDEPERGQRAVAQVVINRVKSGLYPSTVCGVIYQNASHRNACQFSYACDGKRERITEMSAWRRAKKYAEDALAQRAYLKDVADATHYHADYVWPDWRFEMKRLKQIGTHIFYTMRTHRSA